MFAIMVANSGYVDVEQFIYVGMLVGLHAPDNRATYTYSIEQINNLVLLTAIVY